MSVNTPTHLHAVLCDRLLGYRLGNIAPQSQSIARKVQTELTSNHSVREKLDGAVHREKIQNSACADGAVTEPRTHLS